MIVDRNTAHRLVVGEITQARLPRHLRAPRPGQVIPVRKDTFGGDMAGALVVRSSYLSRRRDHPAEEVCPRYVQPPAAKKPRAWQCSCPLIGHDDTLTPEALKALGHCTLSSYVRAWMLEREQPWLARRSPAGTLAATTFMAAEAALAELPDARIFDRWQQRWADLSVWVIEWEPQVERPRLLAYPGRLRFRRDHNGRHVVDKREDHVDEDLGYTARRDRALAREPEAIDTDRLGPRWERSAAERHAAAIPAERRAHGLAQRLRGL